MVGRSILASLGSRGFFIDAPSSGTLDLTDFRATEEYIKTFQPDIIIHAAGKVGGIQANIADPIQFLDQNMLIGRNIVIASMNNNVKNFINLSSSCIYPKFAENPLTEDQILTGTLEPTNEGYALAKIAILRLCSYIDKQKNGFNYKTIVPCNLYGVHDSFLPENSHLLPAIIHKLHIAKTEGAEVVEIWGDGVARREFMYVSDLADAIGWSIDNLTSLPTVFNCGFGRDYSVRDYYDEVAKVIGWSGEFVFDLTKPSGMKQKLCDSKILRSLGWQPKVSLGEGLNKTYEFYLENIGGI